MFKFIILFSALLIATCAGYFSVFGIGRLFTGAPITAMIMAASLELGKLVVVSFLYRSWQQIGKLLRIYYIVASVVLMLITSIGIYGYLSSAYAVSAASISAIENQVSAITAQQGTVAASVRRMEAQIARGDTITIQQESRLDNLVGKNGFVTQQRTVQQHRNQMAALQTDLLALSRVYDSLEFKKSALQTSITTSSDVGTFYYVATMMNVPLDVIVKWFILAIVLVFDPLSITLIIAYNTLAHRQLPKSSPPSIFMDRHIVPTSDDNMVEEDVPTEIPPDPEPIPEPEVHDQFRHGVNIHGMG